LLSHLDKTKVRIKTAEEVRLLLDGKGHVVTKAIADDQILRRSPVVLEKEAEALLRYKTATVPDPGIAAPDISGDEIFRAADLSLTRTVIIAGVVAAAGTKFSPETKAVGSEQVGRVVANDPGLIGSGE
jgi:hypothetical protein